MALSPLIDKGWLASRTCKTCGHFKALGRYCACAPSQAQLPLKPERKQGETRMEPQVEKIAITAAGQPCRHCGTPVRRKEHTKPPRYKQGGYYFEWWFKCPNKKCKALYMVEDAKRWFDDYGNNAERRKGNDAEQRRRKTAALYERKSKAFQQRNRTGVGERLAAERWGL